MSRIPRACSLVLLCAALASCAGGGRAPERPETRPLQVEAAGIFGGPAVEGGLSSEDLSAKVERLLSEGKRGSADRLVRRHLDTAYLALSSGVSTGTLTAIAFFYDRHTSIQGVGSGWEALLRDRVEHPDRYRDYDEARHALARLLREGRTTEAADADAPVVPEGSPAGPVLRVEAARLRGVALLLAERSAEAAEELEPGIAAARSGRPHDAAHLLLLLTEARRRAGASEPAQSAWAEAVERASALADRVEDVFDPGFWERAANLRPAGAAWPPLAKAMLLRRAERVAGLPASLNEADGAFWACLGAQRLARGESRSALVAFTRPDASEAARDFLMLGQARALAAVGQVQAARTLLGTLAARPSGPVVRPAEALLGSLDLKLGAVERAVALLRKATDGGPEADWPNRASAEANLGLALLASGDEKEGLRWLRAAQQRFDAAKDVDGLVQALRNELRWAEKAGREDAAERARSRLAELEGA